MVFLALPFKRLLKHKRKYGVLNKIGSYNHTTWFAHKCDGNDSMRPFFCCSDGNETLVRCKSIVSAAFMWFICNGPLNIIMRCLLASGRMGVTCPWLKSGMSRLLSLKRSCLRGSSRLSVGGRLTLLKAVLGSTPIYNMSLFKVPKQILPSLPFSFAAIAAIVSVVCQANDHNFEGIRVPKQKRNTGTKEIYVFLFR
nr:RNA-directed DNA polymerase, eukaryota, reverse transcriptase zinc-binding domain protein [Tanacetum cinerariifolium]